MLPLSSVIKDAFDKFEHDFQATNLPDTSNTSNQPCYEEKIQELNTDFAKICITPKPPGAPMGKVPLPILKELEHQAWKNIFTLNFTAAFAKTSSSCNATLEKCQHSLKSTFKIVKSQVQQGANPEKAAKRGYEQACEYLSYTSANPLSIYYKREFYTVGNTSMLKCKAKITLLQPQGKRDAKNSGIHPLGIPTCSSLNFSKRENTSSSNKAHLKTLRVSHPIKIRDSRGCFSPHNMGRGHGNSSPNDSLKASLSPPLGDHLCSFRRD